MVESLDYSSWIQVAFYASKSIFLGYTVSAVAQKNPVDPEA